MLSLRPGKEIRRIFICLLSAGNASLANRTETFLIQILKIIVAQARVFSRFLPGISTLILFFWSSLCYETILILQQATSSTA